MLIQTTFRILNPFGAVTFKEVLLADVFTSLSKSLVDQQMLICAVLSPDVNTTGVIKNLRLFRQCHNTYLTMLVMAFPFILRFRQCITQFIKTTRWSNVYNAIKYLSSLPVIVLSVLKASSPTPGNETLA